MERIIVIKLGALGDVIRTLPIAEALKKKYSDSEITWVTKENKSIKSLELFENNPYIDKVFPLPFNTEEEFDLLYNFDIEKDATDLASSIKAKKKLGFYSEESYPAAFNFPSEYYLNTLFDDELKRTNKKTYQQMMFEAAELPFEKESPKIFLSKENREYAEKFFKENSIPKSNLIGIHIGSSPRWPSKVWAEENVKEFIIKAKEKGFNILVFGGPDEIERHKVLTQELKEKGVKIYRSNPHNSLKEFCSLVNFCDYMVCSDSLALHVSLALSKTTIGLFFCTSANEVEGYGLLKKKVSPMLFDFFPEKMDKYSRELTSSISAEEVLQEIINSKKKEVRVVNALILNKSKDKFLTIKRKSGESIHSGKWAFPGGIVEGGESDEEALKREIKEETNLSLEKVLKKISRYEYSREDNSHSLGECYLVETKEEDFSLNEEVEEAKWVTLEEFEKMDHVEGLDEEVLLAFTPED